MWSFQTPPATSGGRGAVCRPIGTARDPADGAGSAAAGAANPHVGRVVSGLLTDEVSAAGRDACAEAGGTGTVRAVAIGAAAAPAVQAAPAVRTPPATAPAVHAASAVRPAPAVQAAPGV